MRSLKSFGVSLFLVPVLIGAILTVTMPASAIQPNFAAVKVRGNGKTVQTTGETLTATNVMHVAFTPTLDNPNWREVCAIELPTDVTTSKCVIVDLTGDVSIPWDALNFGDMDRSSGFVSVILSNSVPGSVMSTNTSATPTVRFELWAGASATNAVSILQSRNPNYEMYEPPVGSSPAPSITSSSSITDYTKIVTGQANPPAPDQQCWVAFLIIAVIVLIVGAVVYYVLKKICDKCLPGR